MDKLTKLTGKKQITFLLIPLLFFVLIYVTAALYSLKSCSQGLIEMKLLGLIEIKINCNHPYESESSSN